MLLNIEISIIIDLFVCYIDADNCKYYADNFWGIYIASTKSKTGGIMDISGFRKY